MEALQLKNLGPGPPQGPATLGAKQLLKLIIKKNNFNIIGIDLG
jgi:hypothetical protein